MNEKMADMEKADWIPCEWCSKRSTVRWDDRAACDMHAEEARCAADDLRRLAGFHRKSAVRHNLAARPRKPKGGRSPFGDNLWE